MEETFAREKKIPFKLSTYRKLAFSKATSGKAVVSYFIDRLVSLTFTLANCKDYPELQAVKAYPYERANRVYNSL